MKQGRLKVMKRDGRYVPFDSSKIYAAVYRAAIASNCTISDSYDLAKMVQEKITKKYTVDNDRKRFPSVEDIQEDVINELIHSGNEKVIKTYIQYRTERTLSREMKSDLNKTLQELTFSKSTDSNIKRDNGNVNGDTAMGTMLQYGSTTSKQFTNKFLLSSDVLEGVESGDIYIHDRDFYPMGTLTCCQIPLDRLFKKGFNTGHGTLRPPQSIGSYASLAAVAIQANQNEMHGGQAIPLFDFYLAPGVAKSFKKNFISVLETLILFNQEMTNSQFNVVKNILNQKEISFWYQSNISSSLSTLRTILEGCSDSLLCNLESIWNQSLEKTEKDTFQAMEGFVHNLNTLHSRAGSQVPFSSVNFGMDTSEEGRMVSRNLMLAQEAGLGNGETPIFPILIFQVKEGVNYNPEDPNYDLFKLSFRVSAKRLFPNYVFVDAPFNLQYYDEKDPETIISTMGCRTRVIGNINGKQTPVGRGNLSFNTINLPRLGIKHGILYRKENELESEEDVFKKYDLAGFMEDFDDQIDLCIKALLERYEYQKKKRGINFPFLMGQGLWRGPDTWSNEQHPNDCLDEIIDSGTLSVGFIGLAECLYALTGHHHGECEMKKELGGQAQKTFESCSSTEDVKKLGLYIIQHLRERMDEATEEYHLNFSVLATPSEGLSGFFTRIDKVKYGEYQGVTDREYYTNSFHVPVYQNIGFIEKIRIEAPYHNLCNAGHITYVEVDGDLNNNLEAFESIIRCMKESGIGYGSVNHPVDRDPVCGYTGIIDGDTCPGCGRKLNEHIHVSKTIEAL